ncbi:phage portal protein [Pseudophaeobacter sp.]|uniref:phage portal protein n=1 Tax=Pseudophaeobacter sp. TaxID=1971739 RepID=UPI003A96A4DC
MIGGFFKRSATAAEEPKRVSPPALYRPRRSSATRFMDAGQSDRMTSGWTNSPLPADQIIRRNWRTLVARSREQAVNNPYGKAFQRSARRNVIGPKGFILQARVKDDDGKLDKGANKAIEDAFKLWSRAGNCDVTGRRSFRQIQKALMNGLVTDGEFMLRFVYGADAGPWGFAIQVLDPMRCPVDMDEERRPGGGFIRAGIEYSKLGRPVAYYFTTLSPNESDYYYGNRNFVRVPADEIVHWFEEDIVGQKRGLPWMATALWRMHQLGEFEKATLVAAREGANKLGFIEWAEGTGPELEEGTEAEDIEIESEAGTLQTLPEGASFKSHDPQFPSGEAAVFSKHMLRGIASGLGSAYNDLANDLEGVNLSSIRHGVLSERDNWQEIQESLIEAFCLPLIERWITHSLLSGRIRLANGSPLPAAKRQKFQAVEFLPRRWAWIDPAKDVKADAEAVDNLFKPRGQVIRERGRDPSEVYAEIAADIEDMRAAGIPEEVITALITAKAKGGQGNGQQGNTPKTGTPGSGSEEDGETD